MLVVFKGIEYSNILIFDAEYNEGDLIQFAAIMFRKVEKDIFQISKSLNLYVKLPEGAYMNRFIREFTGITDLYLENEGLDINQAIEEIDEFMKNEDDIVFVSHGLYNDRQILLDNGVDFYQRHENKNEAGMPGICTYSLAKKVLKRHNKLSLVDVAQEAGLYISNHHNAFDDTIATIAALSLLLKLQEEE